MDHILLAGDSHSSTTETIIGLEDAKKQDKAISNRERNI